MISANPILDLISAQQPSIYYIDQGVGLFACLGSPEGAIACNRGSVACDVLSGDLYRKTTNTVATGWTLVSGGGGGVTGSGTNGKLSKWTGATALGDSLLTESANLITDAGALFVQAVSTSIIPLRVQAPVGLAVEGFNYLDSSGNRRVVISASGTFALVGFAVPITAAEVTDVKLYFDQQGGTYNNQLMMSRAGANYQVVAGIKDTALTPGVLLSYNSNFELIDSIVDGSTTNELNVGGLLKVNFASPAQGQVHIVPASTLTRGVYVNAPASYAANFLKFDVSGSEKLRIDQDGKIFTLQHGIATPSIGPSSTQGLAFSGSQTTMMMTAGITFQIDSVGRSYLSGINNFTILSNTSFLNFGNSTLGDASLGRATASVLKFGSGGGSNGGTWAAIARTPAQITADQDNYNPGGSSYFQRWNTDAARNVTGMTFTATQVDGQTHVIINVGSNNIVIVNESASSTAANRFKNSTGADITLAANEAADIIYDGTQSRWLVFKR